MLRNRLFFAALCVFAVSGLMAGCRNAQGGRGSGAAEAGTGISSGTEAERLLREKYRLTDEMLDGLDAEALVSDYRMDTVEYTAEEVWQIVEDEKSHYAASRADEVFAMLGDTDEIPEDGPYFSETAGIMRVAYYANPGSEQKKMLFDLENGVCYVDGDTPRVLEGDQCLRLGNALRGAGISRWRHRYENGAERETTGSFRWKLVIEQDGGKVCSYGGYTADMSRLPENFEMVDDALSEAAASSRPGAAANVLDPAYETPDYTALAEKLGCSEQDAEKIRAELRSRTGKSFAGDGFDTVPSSGTSTLLRAVSEDGSVYYVEIGADRSVRSVEEADMDSENRKLVAGALGVDRNDRCMDHILGCLDTIGAGFVRWADMGEALSGRQLAVMAQDGTIYIFFLDADNSVEAVQNADTDEWVVTSSR